jgi:quercetin dioxygenase-like cupin family protein
MSFWTNVGKLELAEFRPGIRSKAEIGGTLIMACMEIGTESEDTGHRHPFDQCGLVLEGKIEMFIDDERRILGPSDAYFIPGGVLHGWKTFDEPVKIMDVSAKQN